MGGHEDWHITENGLAQPTDLELVRKARRGDMAAFHGLVSRHGLYLYRLAVRLLGNACDAEDAVQEALSGAHRGLGSFGERSSVRTWLTRILVRQAARALQRRTRRAVVPLQDAQAAAMTEAASEQSDVRMDVQAAIERLGGDHRTVIVLREMEGLSYEEISQVLEIPPGTVESRLFRARRQLQDLLKEYLQ
ncbi:MAG: sigma-70 family RNA polymerase sigma factor [Planctomycetaceae bacterium]|nr:sigma-70 family RNA polymerase sigma factor [Planctomycetaceae bacterium]